MPKVSPNLAIACAMAEAKYVDAGPRALGAGGYSPMTRLYQTERESAGKRSV